MVTAVSKIISRSEKTKFPICITALNVRGFPFGKDEEESISGEKK